MKYIFALLTLFYLISNQPLLLNAQNTVRLSTIKEEMIKNNIERDVIFKKIIEILKDSLSNDSLKVDAILLLDDVGCDSCLNYLIEHSRDSYSYGHGYSDADELKSIPCTLALYNMAINPLKKWQLLSALLSSIKVKERDEHFISSVEKFLLSITSKNAITLIIEKELSENIRISKKPYQKNLEVLLEKLRKQ